MRKNNKINGTKRLPKGAIEAMDNYAVWAYGEAAEQQLLRSTLHEALCTPEGRYGSICWKLFEELCPDWSDDDCKSYDHQGGGFWNLPTAQYCERGNILFISESQKAALDNGKVSFVLEHTSYKGDWRFWFDKPEAFDVVVVVPDAEVKRIAAEYAAEQYDYQAKKVLRGRRDD